VSYFIILVVELNCNRLFVIVECQIKYNCCVEIIDLVLVIASNLSLFELLILQFNSFNYRRRSFTRRGSRSSSSRR
jgi:hypothetical protein